MQTEFYNVRCARCGVLFRGIIRAWTCSGALKKAVVQCDGIDFNGDGMPIATTCATPQTKDRLEQNMRR